MSTLVTVDMIKSFEIGSSCAQSSPCQHSCEIALLDGRTLSTGFSSPILFSLIETIAKEKIVNPMKSNHFEKYNSERYIQWRKGKDCLSAAEDLLTEIFTKDALEKKVMQVAEGKFTNHPFKEKILSSIERVMWSGILNDPSSELKRLQFIKNKRIEGKEPHIYSPDKDMGITLDDTVINFYLNFFKANEIQIDLE